MTPRYYQKQAHDAFFDYALNGGRKGLIVIPTGAGKSLVQAMLIQSTHEKARILCLTHDKILTEQNHAEMQGIIPLIDSGIYCAGLNKRDLSNNVIFATIQSIHNKALHIGAFDIIIVDEAHMIPQKSIGTYRKFLDNQFSFNKNLVLIGMTATHFRLGGGFLTHGKEAIFDKVIHETSIAELMDENHPKNLDKKQYLCPLISKNSMQKVDMTGVKKTASDYNQKALQDVFDVSQVVKASVAEILGYTKDRKKVLIFCAGIEHAEHVASLIPGSQIVHSKKTGNDEIVEDFRSGDLKYLINVAMLTTGFNVKGVDCVVLLFSTLSTSKYVQCVGRGTRIFTGKENCLVLDFGGNIEEHGPIDRLVILNPREGGGNSEQGAPIRECPECHTLVHISVRLCPDCGYEFPKKAAHSRTASEAEVLYKPKPPERKQVYGVEYKRHKKSGKPDSVRVEYWLDKHGFQIVNEWVSIQSDNEFARRIARAWMKKREVDFTDVTEFLEKADNIKKPSYIYVDYNDKFPAIKSYEFEQVNECIVNMC